MWSKHTKGINGSASGVDENKMQPNKYASIHLGRQGPKYLYVMSTQLSNRGPYGLALNIEEYKMP